MRSFIICTAFKYHWGHEIKDDDTGGACSTNEGKRKAYRLLLGKPEGKRQSEIARIDGRITLKMYLKEVG
jgi:hypothetical protein